MTYHSDRSCVTLNKRYLGCRNVPLGAGLGVKGCLRPPSHSGVPNKRCVIGCAGQLIGSVNRELVIPGGPQQPFLSPFRACPEIPNGLGPGSGWLYSHYS